jgi:hypothetical protein
MNAITAVVICDVMNSRDVAMFKDARDSRLDALSKAHRAAGWIVAPYAVTAWDEFQGLTTGVAVAPRVMWSLVTAFHPLHLRIGIGIGAVETELVDDAPLNEAATGEAFFRARAALDLVKRGRDPRYDPSSQAASGDRSVDLFLNTTLHLTDALVARTTPSQWEVILEYERLGRQDRVAARLGKAESTVSRALKRAYYWQMVEAVTSMSEYLELRFPAPDDARAEDCP